MSDVSAHAQSAFMMLLRMRRLVSLASRAYLATGEASARQELEAMLIAESEAHRAFESLAGIREGER